MIKDATYWLEQLDQKALSVPELIRHTAKKIEQLNPQLNAFVSFDAEEAIASYERLPNIAQTAFKGLPFPLKMLGQAKKGWLDTSASRLFLQNKATQTDYFVRQLELSGLTPFGQTNAPEFGFKNMTDPSVYGTTKNPWNLNHTPGGSSGGAAAAVAAGIFPLAGASDGGGSIRIPASFTGLIGLKPTRGTMPVGPGGWRGWQGASINFGLGVSMRDTRLLFQELNTTSLVNPYQAPPQRSVSFDRPLRIAYTASSPIGTKVSTDAKQALTNALRLLERLGHEVIEVDWPVDGVALMQSYYAMNGGETAAMFKQITALLKRDLTFNDMEPMTWAIYQYGKKIDAASYIASLNHWDMATYQMEQLFSSFDLFLTPTTAESAPTLDQLDLSSQLKEKLPHTQALSEQAAADLVYEMFLESLAVTPYTQLANLTGQPAISLPTHLSAQGLPLGIHLMASKGQDQLLLAIGETFEHEHAFILPSYYYKN